ncbi:hypothetical protein IRJ41_018016 [Triplophysa rosa]|uniref:Uncharacterized protein n=1 Tax=Triplophysa rosa TaxID=992332 RepID=A0A9W7TF69_TRIRA|nr:hypothetical protein IRJ41_018016 [Triplophysa rosa]
MSKRFRGLQARRGQKVKGASKLTVPQTSLSCTVPIVLFFSIHYFSFEGCQKPLRWCAEGGQQGGVLQCLGDRLLLRIGGRGGKGGWRLAPMVRKWALRDGRAGGGRPVEDGSARVIRGEGVRDRLTVRSVNASNLVPLKSPNLVSLAGQERESEL